ncbi:MAG: UDP-N-acetylmuramoyl-tripeptide--D-alanyl-D-alanine ligase [Gammaproteobacteria bacterium]|nr:UDP-N-acetylmuramoyl-tripeptide--D-alanyl-D-alanine ligase [Gammaproteobacteria bacterium]MDH5303453.1 UDP-N-acetylmuramoyl-tripeptide--D-alanyl-D-alanine ligase [Gammaproteobacteria bacterium]MDH5321810.1 UDP-N-acetylmuramoyl-tripeptide--D-alanyl-D-alanine ligase [Gammaproteobacteria bacterium]
MNSMLSSAAAAMHGVLHGADRMFDGVSTDTRSITRGQLFFALQGPNFDGGKFVAAAADKGASGAVVTERSNVKLAQIEVADTRLALGKLGAAWRQQHAATVVGVTGSNGKTTLKEMIAACLAQTAPTLATAGNLNNDIGLPLMLLRINAAHRFAVLEMGANHAGEIAYLTSLAQPHVVVISNAGTAHLEGFGSVTGVAEGKGEILRGKPRPRCAILNADDEFYEYWCSLAKDIDVISFGLGDGADVFASAIDPGMDATSFRLHLPAEEIDIRLPLLGTHNVRNACAAAAVAIALEVSAMQIKAALQSLSPVAGRLQPIAGLHGATLYDDSYNANPVSVRAAAEFLAALPGEKWMVLGDMGELGAEAVALHRSVGEALNKAGIDRLFAVGPLSRETVAAFGDAGDWFASLDQLVASVSQQLGAGVSVLVKGSRSARMERVVNAIRAPQPIRQEA